LLAVSLSGPVQDKITVDVDAVRFLDGEQAEAAAVAARRARREALL